MKKIYKGIDAFSKAVSAKLPVLKRKRGGVKLSHFDVTTKIRSAINKSSFKILHEDYKSCYKGDNLYGVFTLKNNISTLPQVFNLSLHFRNSYKSSNSFELSLGITDSVTNTSIILPQEIYSIFNPSFPKLDISILDDNNLSNLLNNHTDHYFKVALEFANELALKTSRIRQVYSIVSSLYFSNSNVINTYDLVSIKDIIETDDSEESLKFKHFNGDENLLGVYLILSDIVSNTSPELHILNQKILFTTFSDLSNSSLKSNVEKLGYPDYYTKESGKEIKDFKVKKSTSYISELELEASTEVYPQDDGSENEKLDSLADSEMEEVLQEEPELELKSIVFGPPPGISS